MYIVAKFYMESEHPLKEALQLLQQDGRFEIAVINNRRIAINGIIVDLPECKEVTKCMERILDKYKYTSLMPFEVLPAGEDVVEELLKKYPELEAFGADWVRKWGRLDERLSEIAEVLRRYPWMADVIKQRPVDNPHPYLVEVYVAVDGSEVCLLLNRTKAYCNGKESRYSLVLRFTGYYRFEDGIKEVYRCCHKKYAKIL
jgi:hypothetical protein